MRREITLHAVIPSELVDQLKGQLAYCDPRVEQIDLSRVSDGIVAVELPADADDVDDKVHKIVGRVVSGGRTPPQKVLHRVGEDDRTWEPEIDQRLAHAGWVQPADHGSYVLAGPMAILMRMFDEDFRALAKGHGAVDMVYPNLLSTRFLKRIHYFQTFPQYTTFAVHLRPDVDGIDAFMERMREQPERIDFEAGESEPVSTILSPTVCYHAYDALSGTSLDETRQITARCACYRWESTNLDHLRRLWEFQMRELITVGDRDAGLTTRDQAMEATLEYCHRLGLSGWVENANDPFFSPTDSAQKAAYQRGMGMKWELRLPLDASGRSLAAASFNNMQRTFGESCDITYVDGTPAFSGCAGWGLERWAYAFVCQHGMDTDTWPSAARAHIRDAGLGGGRHE